MAPVNCCVLRLFVRRRAVVRNQVAICPIFIRELVCCTYFSIVHLLQCSAVGGRCLWIFPSY